MTPEQWKQLDDLFENASSLPSDQWDHFAAAHCEPTLRAELLSLLRAQDDPLLKEPVAAVATLIDSAPSDPVGSRLGAYTIISTLGRGGMGVVYEAAQDSPRRTVALKVIRPGALSPAALRRFQREAEVLGRLQHPGVAQIYESGQARTALGLQPYFAMELVRGKPLPEYARDARLSIRQRLELLAKVCDAVQFAHGKGVIHRDLKPGNILIDGQGQSPQPKILDFGIARLTDSDIQLTTIQTDIGQLIGTLPYMSPEQAAGDPRELDVRSDVYALGVVLYELLSGRLPYELKDKPVPEAVRILAEQDHTRLSIISKVFRGDIETIAAKALEKDRNRRYQSAADLASDIRRYLSDQAISARPASTIYQLRKFARRNKALVGGIIAAFLLLTAGIIGTSLGLLRARDAEKRAKNEATNALDAAARAEQINSYLANMLEWFSADNTGGPQITLKQVLDEAARRVSAELKDRPLIAAPLHESIARSYLKMAAGPECAAQYQAAHALFDQLHDELAAVRCLVGYAEGLKVAGDLKASEAAFREGIAALSRLRGPEHAHVFDARAKLAQVLKEEGNFTEAFPLLVDAVAHFRKNPADKESLIDALNGLALVQRGRQDLTGGEKSLREAIQLADSGSPEPNLTSGVLINNLANNLKDQERFDEAVDLYKQSYEIRKRLLGDDNAATTVALNNLATLYVRKGDYAAAVPQFEHVLELRRRLGGPDLNLSNTLEGLADALQGVGRPGAAVPYLRESAAIRAKVLSPDHVTTQSIRGSLADALVRSGAMNEACVVLPELIQSLGTVRFPTTRSIAKAWCTYVDVLAEDGKLEEAEKICREVVEGCSKGKNGYIQALSNISLANILNKTGRADDAEAALAKAREAAPLADPQTRATARCHALSASGRHLLAHNRPAEAEPLLRETLAIAAAANIEGYEPALHAAAALAELLIAAHHPDQARTILTTAQSHIQPGASPACTKAIESALQALPASPE